MGRVDTQEWNEKKGSSMASDSLKGKTEFLLLPATASIILVRSIIQDSYSHIITHPFYMITGNVMYVLFSYIIPCVHFFSHLPTAIKILILSR